LKELKLDKNKEMKFWCKPVQKRQLNKLFIQDKPTYHI